MVMNYFLLGMLGLMCLFLYAGVMIILSGRDYIHMVKNSNPDSYNEYLRDTGIKKEKKGFTLLIIAAVIAVIWYILS